MKKTIKIIDLLNKIANGEEVPNFWWSGCIHKVEKDINGKYNIFDTYCKKYKNIYLEDLNDEVKIIEEDEEEFEDIKPLEQIVMKKAFYKDSNDLAKDVSISFEKIDDIVISINDLIKNQKKIIEKLNKNNNNI